VTAREIKLGAIFPDTGALAATFAPIRNGIDARIGEANAAGGVHGRQISYVWSDDRGDPGANLEAAQRLVQDEKVFGIAAFSASMTGGSAEYLAAREIPVTGLAAEPVWSHSQNMFAFAYTVGTIVDTYGQWTHLRGGTKAVVLQSAAIGATDTLGKQMMASMSGAGIATLPPIAYSTVTGSDEQIAEQIVDSGADVLVSMSDPDRFAQIVQATRAAGADIKVALSLSGYDPSNLHELGGEMAGITIPVFHTPLETNSAAIRRFRQSMVTYAPEGATDHEFALLGYIGTDEFIKGLEVAGPCPTRAAFINGMHSLTNYDAGGLVPAMDIKNHFAAPTRCFSFVTVNAEGTAFVPLGNACDGAKG
jgi:ABC-type branched-subunit amino acid transport system substrate-binding protein